MADILDAADLKAVAFGNDGWIREDLMNRIIDISDFPRPLSDMIGTDTASNDYTEWTKDELAAPNKDNAVVDGFVVTTEDDTKTGERVGNHCQAMVKVVKVSTRAQSSDTVQTDALIYQVMQRSKEIRRDEEAAFTSQNASVKSTGSAGTPGKLGGLAAWCESNTDGAGADGGFNLATGVVDAPTGGAGRGLTETMISDVVESIHNNGGDPSVLMTVPKLKKALSAYLFSSSARIATLMSDTGTSAEDVTAKGSVGVYVTDFATLELVSNRLQPMDSGTGGDMANVLIIDPAYLTKAVLTGYRVEPLAKRGTLDERLMCVDLTLKVLTEKAHGCIRDIDPTIPVAA